MDLCEKMNNNAAPVLSNHLSNHITPQLMSIVVCLYNEEEIIDQFLSRLFHVLTALGFPFEVIMVNDGSQDTTLQKILSYCLTHPEIKVINLSRNFGKEAALTAGLDATQGDVIIPIDSDLQDPPELIAELIKKWQEGFDVVLARRSDRSADSFIKRITAKAFYKIHNALSEIQIPHDAGDFRLMDRKVIEALKLLPENRRFMKGLFAWIGFNATAIDYTRPARVGGESKFSLWKLWNLGLEGLTSFSTLPLRVWTYIGLIISFCAFLYIILVVFLSAFHQTPFSGYATLVVSIMGFGGLQLIGIGILGEYIGRIYSESKRRPVYIIKDRYPSE